MLVWSAKTETVARHSICLGRETNLDEVKISKFSKTLLVTEVSLQLL